MADKNAQSKSVAELKTASDLTTWLDGVKRHRTEFEKDWKLNLAFYRNNQYCYVSRSGRLETLPTDPGDVPRHRVRITANQVTPGVQSLLAKLTKTKPVLSATPASSSQNDVKAAQMSEQLLEDWWVTMGLEDKLEEALLWSLVAGQGWWKISWDEHAGVPMTFTINPETQEVITNDELIAMYKNQLQSVGLPEDFSDQTVSLGDVRVEVMSPFQVWVDPSVKTWTEAKYAVCEHSLTPDEIYARWKVKVEADSVPMEPDKSLPYGMVNSYDSTKSSHNPTVKKVYIGYFLPQPALPKGRYVVWTEEKQTKSATDEEPKNILEDEPWNSPTNQLPLIKFSGIRVPGSVYDDAVVTPSRPLQKTINKILSDIEMYRNLTLKPRVWAPIGSLKQKYTSEPGVVYEFQPIAGLRPEIEKLPAIPPYVFEHLKDITTRLRDCFALTEVSEGMVPPNVEAGIAIDLLQEMSTDRLAPTIKLIEVSLARAAKHMLTLAQEYYVEPRLLKIRSSGGTAQVKRFKGADIAGGVDVIAESGSGLPRTRAGRQARIESFIDRGILAPHQAWKYLDIADMRSIAAKFAADEDQAFREHDKLIKGEPINQVAMQAAVAAIQQGMNPQTGAEIQDPSEIEQILMDAALAPGPADNHLAHADVHHALIVSVEFEGLPVEIQKGILRHHELTQAAIAAEAPKPEGQSPRVSASIHATAGPTVMSEIMRASGVDVTPQDFLEQPLETLVMDSVDAVDKDEAANDPLTEIEQLAGVAKDVELHGPALRKAEAEAALAEEKVITEKKNRNKPAPKSNA